MSRRYLDSYGAGHGGTAGPLGFCRQPVTIYEDGVAYCGCCGWAFAVQCCVPGCHRTRGNRKGDPLARGMTWLCAEHWPLVPMWMKAIYRRAKKRDRLRNGAGPIVDERAAASLARIWRRITRAAVERSVGI